MIMNLLLAFVLALGPNDPVAVRSETFTVEPHGAMEIRAEADYAAADGRPACNDCMIVAYELGLKVK